MDTSFGILDPNGSFLDLGLGNLHLREMLTTSRNRLVGISLYSLKNKVRKNRQLRPHNQ